MSENEPVKTASSQTAAPKRNFPFKIIPVLLILGIAGFLVWYFVLRQPVTAKNIIEVSGRIESDDATIAPKSSGKIKEIKVREGDQVKAGDVIAVLDDEQLRAREEQAQAAVTQAETRVRRAQQQISVLESQRNSSQLGVEQAKMDAQGRVDQAQAQILQVQAQVAQAQSQVAQTEAQLEQAKTNLQQARWDEEKARNLFNSGDVPEKQYRQAKTVADAQANVVNAQQKQVDVARNALKVSQNALKVAQASLMTTKANLANPIIRASQTTTIDEQIAQANTDIDSANADAERARAQLREAEANRGDLNIVAPFDGTIATRSAEPGEVVSPGTAIATIVNFNMVYLRAYVPESEIGKVKIGQAARVFLDSNPNQPIDAEVLRIDPEATFTPENTYFRNERVKQVIGVKLVIKNPQGFSKPGMPADGEILVNGEWTSIGRIMK
ncbi:MAG: HlyD family efflux transporter periplasmic adaptor subunit [Pyrinomonadaceae bacterium]|nr:HlyD family efflux transporter periplasmic adaptor subunit [Pyrinomonadaceae bacterium]